ncbi:unnamed protein product [Polarella glacialis]|uniref:C3H1-type domain-containing protein n=1 Tax=Polarella glacialis TaxID=89957 RepID=A0A813GI70_POLGL|nr:unnamed protein product [Polarella glacialis]CAE8683813.1 unnamed protein product [Polarella glacialis]
MPLTYCHRSTFIDVIEPHQQAHVKMRSRSVPAHRAAPACEDLELSSYVSCLGQTVMAAVSKDALAHQDVEACPTASPTSSPNKCTSTSDGSSCAPHMLTSLFNHLPDSEMVPEPPAMRPNPGSMEHPELCRQPCNYFAAGSCAGGSACGYCHMSHEGKPSHLDRRNRDLLRSLSEAERLALLLPVLRCRAESTGLAAEAVEVLALLEHKAVACASPSAASMAAASRAARAATLPQLSKLSAALLKISFSTVLGMALRGATSCENKHEEDLAASLDQLLAGAVDRMRARLSPQEVGA